MIRQLPLPFPHSPDFDRARFLRSPANAEALTWLADPVSWPMGRLIVWGEAGSGKSHLLHEWARKHGTTALAGANLRLATSAPRETVVIDDADLARELALFHLLNAAAEAGLNVLLAARLPPARWNIALPDLASRLRAATAVRIRPLEDELLRILLAALFIERQMEVAKPVQEMLLRQLPRSPAVLREAVARLDRLALAVGRRVTRQLAAEIVTELTDFDDSLETFDEDSESYALSASQVAPGFL